MIGRLFLLWLLANKAMEKPRSLQDGPPPSPPQPAPPPGYRRPKGGEVTSEQIAAARAALAEPIGTLHVHDTWAVQVEWHYHPPGGAAHPWGWHKGATIYLKGAA